MIIVASSNKGKLKEIAELIKEPINPYGDVIGDIQIIEDGESFAQNALIKAQAVFEALDQKSRQRAVVIADDSGISIDALEGAPGIVSARFAGEGSSDRDNLQKAIDELQKRAFTQSKAHYTTAIAIVSLCAQYVVHGWMHGKVITTPKGSGGFGYDPIFIPEGFEHTLAQLDHTIKQNLSHRAKALALAKPLIALAQRCKGV